MAGAGAQYRYPLLQGYRTDPRESTLLPACYAYAERVDLAGFTGTPDSADARRGLSSGFSLFFEACHLAGMTNSIQTARERAARALCRMHGVGEDTQFEGRPMWESYLPQVDAVLEAALGPGALAAIRAEPE